MSTTYTSLCAQIRNAMHMVLRRERVKKMLTRLQWDVTRFVLCLAADAATPRPLLADLLTLVLQPGKWACEE